MRVKFVLEDLTAKGANQAELDLPTKFVATDRSMSTHYNVDRESFQTFLANAFALQDSGLDPQSLAALVEIQGFLTSDEFDLKRAMQMIAERALEVSQASGIAVALLEANKNELVYTTGSGSAAKDVGRRVPAVLSVSSGEKLRREILRVENAASDTRIEAEICRQFGAMSLLMLPIFKNHVLAGVLQVLFDGAHSFVDREVRTYRLMVGALEEGMLRDLQGARETLSTVEQRSDGPVASEQYVQFGENIAPGLGILSGAAMQLSDGRPASDPDVPAETRARVDHDDEAIVVGKVSGWRGALTKTFESVVNRSYSSGLANSAAAFGAVIVLGVSIWLSYRSHSYHANVGLPVATASDGQRLAPASLPLVVSEGATSLDDGYTEATAPSERFKRVQIGPDEVDYVSKDVTIRHFDIRHFEKRPAKTKMLGDVNEVDFGDDVTVRYFAGRPVPVSRPSDANPLVDPSKLRAQ